ncbi:chemokine (C-X-C motif) ligand 32b, duplicate 1 [Triplophysa dalaica]|uniref:chemokine (C-X-C motif) ligand 32b, duplicate 1 n=1 Tax=Triplophysa dalaica TaxID=1582913 RepID=UPI0024DF745E|nr:chemokine (C-X-C motif) ligand 32b, duplicate 1 [Triplophysa dalaica]
MGSLSISLLLCLATVLLTNVTCQRKGRSVCPCLKTTNTVLSKKNIVYYKRQKAGTCHIDAIVFTTVKNRIICADPKKTWVTEAIQYVDKKKGAIKSTARPVNSTPTYKTTPAQNTTSDLNTTQLLKEPDHLKSAKKC